MNDNELELATMASRIKAFIIDDLLISLVFVIIFWQKITSSDGELMNMLIIMNENVMQVLFLKFIYQGFFVWYYGATLGKLIAKIKVIDYNHFGRVSIATSFARSIIRIFSEMFFYIGFVFGFFNDGRQTLHDKISKTLVVNA